ncbi:MAG: chemotaxis-specific protein-glutamate methyltransferase CheB [Bdellovibrionales bacterium]
MSIASSLPGASTPHDKQIHVMLADDSAVIRGGLKRTLSSAAHINIVKSVSDGQQAVEAAGRFKPHVIILDIEMPVMDGLTALPQILQKSPQSKVVMFSSLTEKGATVTMQAMQKGAVECLVKPSSAQDVGEGSPFQKNLISLIENLVPPHLRRAPEDTDALASAPAIASSPIAPAPMAATSVQLKNDANSFKGKPSIVAIGSSTGGPQALFNVLKHCKGFDVPIVITQHMPATFTKILAEHIQQQTGIPAQEGAQGMPVKAGQIYVAPGGFHMTFARDGAGIKIVLEDGPLVNFCKPAVDPMFESIVGIYGQRVLGVILTGMGADGLGGGKALTAVNGRLIAQDEATSVVWGMPAAVAKAGLCSAILPLSDIGPWIYKAVMQ